MISFIKDGSKQERAMAKTMIKHRKTYFSKGKIAVIAAIAAMMALINDFYKKNSVTKGEYKTLLTLLNPVAPHITEELWEITGCSGRIYQGTWPEYDEAKTVENEVEIAVQVNGKTRVTISIAKDEEKDSVLAKAKEALGDRISGNIIKEIYVPGRIVNIVCK